ncbi:MAG: hypothetical protein P8O22_06375 [Akkermansiaceae bacterium]|nr:hypothetical protein [Akkermansiaceae bacterium]
MIFSTTCERQSAATSLMHLLVFLTVAACSVAFADEQTIGFRTLCFQHQEDIKKVLTSSPDGKDKGMLEVPINRAYSEKMKMTAKDGLAVFAVKVPGVDGEEPTFRTVARAKLPASRQVLFVFLPGGGKGAKHPYRLLALPDDERSFPWGHVRMINIAPVSVRFNLGEYSGTKARTLKPNTRDQVAKIRKLNPYNMYNVVIEFQSKSGFAITNNTRWKSIARKRDLAISFLHPKTRRPTVALFQDLRRQYDKSNPSP